MKRILIVFIFLGILLNLYAGGSKDIDTIDITSVESWQETLDIAAKKKGKYNVLITAKDEAGNEGYAGPFNVYVDPDSDLPVTHIANPSAYSKITGNIDIIGTCIDDDAVDRIELKIDNGNDIYRAKGKEFWSYYLNTSTFDEGLHSIEAWGVDINGVQGKSTKTFFYLDRQQPKINVTNTGIGSLVSGTITLEGTVEDGNGIERLLYSLDNGENFTEIKLSYNKKTKQSGFKLKINTKAIQDGPNVCWFKAIDKQGSTGIYTFLFFVDNVPPEIEFIYPEDDTMQGSVFSVAGRAFDKVGLQSLKWILGKDSGDIPIAPGNEYWVKEFDLSKTGGKSAVIEIVGMDVAGNTVKAKKTVNIDKTKDKPMLSVISPKPDTNQDGAVFISGLAYSSTGIGEVRYRIDKGEEKIVETNFGAFGVIESQISDGEHLLTIYAVNSSGIAGTPQIIKFSTAGKAPSILFENGKTVIPYYDTQSKASTAIRIKSETGLKSISVKFNDEEETAVSIKEGIKEYVLKTSIGAKPHSGIHTADITAVDLIGKTTRQKLAIAVINPSETETSEIKQDFVLAEGALTSDNLAVTDEKGYLNGVYYASGASIDSVELLGTKDVAVEFEGNMVKFIAKKDGTYKNLSLKIQDNTGNSFTSKAFNIFCDVSMPKISLDAPIVPSFVKNSITFSGNVTDESGVGSVEYTLTGLSEENLLSGKLSFDFKETVNLSSFPDGPVLLVIKASDVRGGVTSESRVFIKDGMAPEVSMVLPLQESKVNGSITAAFKVTDQFCGVKAEYTADEKSGVWRSFDYNTLPNIVIGSAQEPISKKMQFRFTDQAGNVTLINSYNFEIDNSSDSPIVEIHLPMENAVINKDFEISGIVYDDDAPARIYYKIDNEAYKSVDINNSFAIPIPLSYLTDNEHTITLYGEDIYGVKSNPVSRKIRVSLEPPTSDLTAPDIATTSSGLINILGKAADKNGVKQVEISINNGNLFCLTEGTENWKYTVNTEVIGDGTHVVFIKTTDNYGQESLSSGLINIDNTPPVLRFEYPLPGSKLDGELFVSGQINDNISLEGVELKIKSLSGTTVPANLANIKLETVNLISKEIDISSLAEGRYNLEISGVDKAGNTGEAAINFDVYRKKDKDRIELLYPLNGETVCGEFNIYGRVDSASKIQQVSLFIDGNQVATTEISKTAYAAFNLNSDLITEGEHKIEIKGILPNNKVVSSEVHGIKYKVSGPWVTIDNFAMGDFAIERPYLKGRAGYNVSDEERVSALAKDTPIEEKRAFKAKRLKRVEISFNNGKTFVPVKSGNKWKYRLETEDLAEGYHFLLVRAVMENNEIALSRTIIRVDNDMPEITLLAPGSGGRYNGEMTFVGLASDNVKVESIQASLRKGDKASYELPKFIQGLHFETAFWGATLWNMGVGLSFFDDNVKLQLHYGQFLQSQFNKIHGNQQIRYGGHVFSLKLLANIFEMPFGHYFGPDWKWLYMNLALGAQFSLFTDTQSGKPQVLSALLTQIEFPRVKFHKQKYFSSFSLFTEGQLWFIPTDVDSKSKKSTIKSVIPHISAGIRVDIF